MTGFENPISRLSATTVGKLEQYCELIRKWNPAINLVAKSTLVDIWERHIVDSAQVFACFQPAHRLWLDIGSGGGLPGVVVAVLASELAPDLRISLVESDQRKAVFLRETSRQLGLRVNVHCARAEALPPQNACVVSARALAPLSQLCTYAERHLRDGGICAFLKGANATEEVVEARKLWKFDVDRFESLTDGRSSVLMLKGLDRV